MKAQCKTTNGRIAFECQADSVKTLFQEIGQLLEIFDAETECGCCHSKDIRIQFAVRSDFDFYEFVCMKCRAQFQFGQSLDKKSLFPKRKDKDGNWLPNGGWFVYAKQEQEKPAEGRSPARPPTSRAAAAPPLKMPVYKTWDDAEADKANWGTPWLNVEGAVWTIGAKGTYELWKAGA